MCRYTTFINSYIDQGIYRWNNWRLHSKDKVQFTERELRFPSDEVNASLKLEMKIHPIRVGYEVEARPVNSCNTGDITAGKSMDGNTGGRSGDTKGEGKGEQTVAGSEGHSELVGRAFSGSRRLAQQRATEKLAQRPIPYVFLI